MKIGIAGVGCVGGALSKYLEENNHEVIEYDPPLKLYGDLALADLIFICVPAPTLEDRSIDLSIIESILNDLNNEAQRGFDGLVCIRSSILPGTTNKFQEKYQHLRLYFVPEFLLARQAYQDIKRQPIIVGIPDHIEWIDSRIASALISIFPIHDLRPARIIEAELAKYVHNCFGALQVNYFNIIYQVCINLDCNYENVVDAISEFPAMSKKLIKVPGPDGQRGYGGACFPKDLSAFIGLLEYFNIDSLSISGTELDNFYYRSIK